MNITYPSDDIPLGEEAWFRGNTKKIIYSWFMAQWNWERVPRARRNWRQSLLFTILLCAHLSHKYSFFYSLPHSYLLLQRNPKRKEEFNEQIENTVWWRKRMWEVEWFVLVFSNINLILLMVINFHYRE